MVLVLSFGCSLTQEKTEATETKQPNIVLIMSDDMGYSDIGSYGGEIETPNLDQLAANGLRFTQFYNTSRCCPTRASLLTGLYPQQAGVGHMMNDRGTPAYQGDLSKHAVTISEALKTAGYSTYMSGKWHVTPYLPERGDQPPKDNWPLQRGFDSFFGTIHGAGSFYDPNSLTEGNEYIVPDSGFYYTNAISDKAVNYIQDHSADQPFFMYVSYTAAHWPMHALPKDIAKYKGRYDQGWDVVREQRLDRMRKLGLIDPTWNLTTRDSLVAPWSDDIAYKDWEIANMEVYAAMVDNMDQGIGEIIGALKARGEFENTLIFFLQDNGACAEELEWIDLQARDEKAIEPMAPDELQTDMVPLVSRDGKKVRMGKGTMPGPADTYTAYGRTWANASNTPFRRYKHWVHEGGISTPLIVHYPDGIEANGVLRNQPGHLIDIMATCVDVANVNYPKTFNGNDITPMAGVSLVPAFKDEDLNREAIYWEHEGNRAVRMGKYKLVSTASNNSYIWDKVDTLALPNWELFDMQLDRTETNNIAPENPKLVTQMANMWIQWAWTSGALPRPN